jgi:hypothetical protein
MFLLLVIVGVIFWPNFLLQIPMLNTNQNCVSISAKDVRCRFQVPPPKSNAKTSVFYILACKSKPKKKFNFS